MEPHLPQITCVAPRSALMNEKMGAERREPRAKTEVAGVGPANDPLAPLFDGTAFAADNLCRAEIGSHERENGRRTERAKGQNRSCWSRSGERSAGTIV